MKMLKMHRNSFESYEFFQKCILTSDKSLLSTVRTCYCQTQKHWEYFWNIIVSRGQEADQNS